MFASATSYSAPWITDNVLEVAIKYENACVVLNNGEVIKINLETKAGQAEFSIALAAKAANKRLGVSYVTGPLVGGCDTGATIKPHIMLKIIE